VTCARADAGASPGRTVEPVPSPCIGVCSLDGASGLCRGCHRTLEEIAAWPASGETERRSIHARAAARAAATRARGG
jgi:predicted Fe-S protein YdhL (DUF1289 family)